MLCYHTFDSPKVTPYTVTSRMFREQMRYLAVQHLPVISLRTLVEHLQRGTPIPDHAIVITIDDGYKSAWTKAWPILHEFKFPFTVFIYPQFIGRTSALDWDEVEELVRHGVDIQCHSYTHPLLTHPPRAMNGLTYGEWLDHELLDSKRTLETHTGKRVSVLAYPFGGYDETIVERTRRSGYVAAVTCDDGNINHLTEPLHINRRLVYRTVRLKEFIHYFPDRELIMTDLSPRDGERIRGPIKEIRARIANLSQVLPGSTRVLIDKLGRKAIPVPFDPKTGVIRISLPPNPKRGYYFISLFARDRNNPSLQREASWIFINSKNTSKT